MFHFVRVRQKQTKIQLDMSTDKTDYIVNEPNEGWGGPWTEKKLEAFGKYVWSYLTIMKNYPYWKTIYFDGFAGSGTRSTTTKTTLFDELGISEEETNYRGAAERVLNLKDGLGFDYHYFIDMDEKSIQSLEAKLKTLPEAQSKSLSFKSGDSNHWLDELCKALKSPKKFAALVFLDPFGMQIDWESIAQFKGTRSDVWILVPTGVIVNRLLDRKGELKNIGKLQSFFGLPENEIREIFYQKEVHNTLFGEQEVVKKVLKPIEQIAEVYVRQLKTIWTHVTEKPLRLNNTRGVPIFHFVFASNNANAVKIAKQIIQTF